jgi:hypothetical protein
VKTRLIGPLTGEEASDLHRALVRDAWAVLQRPSRNPVFVYTDAEHPEWEELAGRAGWRLQSGGDLGERMFRCFRELQAAGFGPTLIVGSDTAGLTARHVAPWVRLLRDADAVLGPAGDGGYWSVGCRSPDSRMFDGVHWSSTDTLQHTLDAFRRLGWKTAYLEAAVDVDTPGDLERLAGVAGLGPHTRRWLKSRSYTDSRNSMNRRA